MAPQFTILVTSPDGESGAIGLYPTWSVAEDIQEKLIESSAKEEGWNPDSDDIPEEYIDDKYQVIGINPDYKPESINDQIIAAATDQDYDAATNWDYITSKARDWNESAQEQFMEDYCEFSRAMETLHDTLDVTYADISAVLIAVKSQR